MRLAGAIIALIAGIFATFAAGFTLFVGGVGGALRTDNASLVIALGWGGVAFSFATIILGAIGIGNKTKTPGALLILSSLAGALLGGTFVALFMVLAFVGGILIIIGGGVGAAPNSAGRNERPSSAVPRQCTKCNSPMLPEQGFCGSCGTAVAGPEEHSASALQDGGLAAGMRVATKASKNVRSPNWLGWIGGATLVGMIGLFASLAVIADREKQQAQVAATSPKPSSELLAELQPRQSSDPSNDPAASSNVDLGEWCKNTPYEAQVENPRMMAECIQRLAADSSPTAIDWPTEDHQSDGEAVVVGSKKLEVRSTTDEFRFAEGFDLLWGGVLVFSEREQGWSGVDLKTLQGRTGLPYALILLNSGGTMCPMKLRLVDLSASPVNVTQIFGTCSDYMKVDTTIDGLRIIQPDSSGDQTTFLYTDRKIVELPK